MSLFKSVAYITFFLFLLSCEKETEDSSPGVIISPYENTGTNYQASTTCDYNLNETDLLSTGWTKSFEDNFDADLSKWNIWTAGAYNGELQYYQAPNLQLSNGILAVVVKKESVTGAANPFDKTQKSFKYTSGRIESKTLFAPDAATPKMRIAARIKLPKGYGMNAGVLSYGQNLPTGGQIDLLTAYGQDPTRYTTNYYYGTKPLQNIVQGAFGYITADADLTSCYHVYEVEWTKDALLYYLDGKLVERKTAGGYVQDLFGKKQSLSLYVAVNSDFLTRAQIQSGTMYVDWVKVFTAK
jgi:beta-glucanase (GH16 family)